jgi:purine-nucleoside phosphorylase
MRSTTRRILVPTSVKNNMTDHVLLTQAEAGEAAASIRSRTRRQPKIALILGSGLNPLADEIGDADLIPYAEIPHFVPATIPGHVGRLVIGHLAGQPVLVMQGRYHAYEGLSLKQVTLPVRVMHELGIETLIVTNAAGGVNPAYRAGDLMLIVDHLALASMAGQNPLIGPNDDTLGPRFVDMNRAYDPALRRLTLNVADSLRLKLHQGVYAGLSGPTFETPAEVRFLRMAGADAVGMSTVSEVIVARHMGIRVLGISGISNAAVAETDSETQVDHEEVLLAGQALVPKLMSLLRGVLAKLPVL